MATRKYRRAVECLMKAGVRRPVLVSRVTGDSSRLFRVLRDLGFRWDAKTGDWMLR